MIQPAYIPIKRVDRGFTLVEQLVVLSVIAVLMALILPLVGRIRNKAKQVITISNLRSIGTAAYSFAADNSGQLPSSSFMNMEYNEGNVAAFCRQSVYYPALLLPYTGNWNAFYSPMDKNRKQVPEPNDQVSYFWRHSIDVWAQRSNVKWAGGASGRGLYLSHFEFPSRQFIAYERYDWHGSNVGYWVESKQKRVGTVLFADGSVRNHEFGPEYGSACDPHWFPYRNSTDLAGFNLRTNYDSK